MDQNIRFASFYDTTVHQSTQVWSCLGPSVVGIIKSPCISFLPLLSHSSPMVGLSSRFIPFPYFDCHGDTHLQSTILSLYYLIIYHFSGWASCLGGKGSTDWEVLLCKHRDQSGAEHWHCPWSTAQELQIWALHGSPEPPRASGEEKSHISPAWYRSAAAVTSQRVRRE